MASKDGNDDIAIIGFAFKFPGEATSSAAFWNMLIESKSSLTDVPSSRWNIASFCEPKTERGGTIHAQGGNFLRDNIAAFDAPFFSMNPAEAKCLDPQQRLLLETTYHSLESSGITMDSIRGSNTAVYVGSFMRDYEIMLSKDPELPARYKMSGTSVAMLANRISWFYDFKGPSIALDTACSSSLTALHLACQAVRSGESEMGVVAGSNLVFGPEASIGLSDMNFLSPDSKCYSFDHRANGYARGEGVGVAVIKTVSQAVKDGNTIRAVIRASGSNQDGKTPGITQPSSEAQEALIRQTYENAGLEMACTRYFEAHGTGTSLGDPIEAKAIGASLGTFRTPEEPLYVGAVKSNIGHLEGASGVAGLIKTILVLEKGCIPPNINFEKPNPKILLDDWNIRFPLSVTPWPTDGLRRASLSSFGFGGSNVHVVMDDAFHYLRDRNIPGLHHTSPPPYHLDAISTMHDDSSSSVSSAISISSSTTSKLQASYTGQRKLLVWSASDANSLSESIKSFETYLTHQSQHDTHPQLSDIAYTLSEKRTHHPWKSYLAVDGNNRSWIGIAAASLKPTRSLKTPKAGFIFTGQGAQWSGMGLELLIYPAFRASLEIADVTLRQLGASWSVLDELYQKDELSSKLESPEYGQPLTTVLQIALVDLLADWGISPSVVIGHSSGEIAAAYCTGAISRQSAWKIAYFRGVAISSTRSSRDAPGAMIAVGLSPDETEKYITEHETPESEGHITIACINSPRNVTLSGPSTDIELLKDALDKEGVFCRRLRVNIAYHSKYMDLAGSVYKPLIDDLEPGTMKDCLMISTVTGKVIHPQTLTQADHWVQNLVSTVRFSEAVSQLCVQVPKRQLGKSKGHQLAIDYFVEIGPHSTLQGPIRDILSSSVRAGQIEYCSVLLRGESAQTSIFEAVGKLHCHGFTVDVLKINEPDERSLKQCKMLVDLPAYCFDHRTKYWLESRISKNYRFGDTPYHELLGSRVADWNPLEARWRNILTVSNKSWVKDHVINGVVLYPGVGLLVMAIEAARQLLPPDRNIKGYRFKNVAVYRGLVVPSEAEGVEVQLYLRPSHDIDAKNQEQMWDEFRICFYESEQWVESCRGAICVEYDGLRSEVAPQWDLSETLRYSQEYHEGEKLCRETLSSKKLYEAFRDFGYSYGESFRLLKNTRFSESLDAVGDINLLDWKSTITENEIRPHVIHPAVLDCVLQLIFPSMTKGCTESVPTMVPTLIKNLWISNFQNSDEQDIKVHMKGGYRGRRGTNGIFRAIYASTGEACIAGDFEMTFVSGTAGSSSEDRTNSRRFYNLDWKPDTTLLQQTQISALCTDFGDVPTPFAEMMLDEKEVLCMWAIRRIVRQLPTSTQSQLSPHLRRYIEWMRKQQMDPRYPSLEVDDGTFNRMLDKIEGCDAEGALLARVMRNLDGIFEGKVDTLELLFRDKLLERYYLESHDSPFIFRKVARYIDALAHKNPNLKVLEIGAGTGSATKSALDALVHHGDHELGADRFSEYFFTDISPTFFEEARGKFRSKRITYKVLDIEKDISSKDFKAETFDLIIAANVLHATSDIQKTLHNTRKLLKVGGKLALFEITDTQILRIPIIFGLLSGWWKGVEEYRAWGPTMDTSKWDENLRSASFSGADVIFSNQESLNNTSRSLPVSAIISTAMPIHSRPINRICHKGKPRILIITDESELQQRISAKISDQISHIGHLCTTVLLEDVKPCVLHDAVCIFLPDISSSWFHAMDDDKFNVLKLLVSQSQRLLWVFYQDDHATRGPDRQLVLGFSRSVQNEREDFKFITVEFGDISSCLKVSQHILKILIASLDGTELQETEYIIDNDTVCIGRIVEARYLSDQAFSDTSKSDVQLLKQKDRPLMMSVESVGMLDTIQFVDDEKFGRHMADDEVEIEVKAVGINFKDILVALGQIPESVLGSECAGVVSRVGRTAKERFNVGDRVACAMKGSYRTYGRCRASCATKIPSSMSYTTAAGMIIVFATAYYCLVKAAQIQRGESVLIHSGAGGLGQASIQLAKIFEANIYVTVSTNEKKNLLMQLYDIPEDHFFSSRTLAFKEGIMRMTKGRGVDVIINSLSGEALRCSWECIAPLGRFVEVGKRDILAPPVSALGGLPMAQFSKNTTFASVDLTIVLSSRPELAKEMITAVMELAEAGKITIPKPMQVFQACQIEEAFRFMQGGKHTGKCVVEFGDLDMISVNPPRKPHAIFDPHSTYVIAGGLGGIGQSIAKWMATQNVKHLVLLSRKRVYSKQILVFLENLKAKGVDVFTPPCDITDEAGLTQVLKTCGETMPPIRGCIQGSMVLKSVMFSNMNVDDFYTSVKPKVDGSWNLHKLLPAGLDFFIMLSSYAGIVGSLGQSNYAAGNTYQDGLARYRVSIGEKAICLDLGVVESVGFVAEHDEIGGFLRAGGHETLAEVDLHNIIGYYCNPNLNLQSQMKSRVVTGLPLPATLKAKNLVQFDYLSRPLFQCLHQIDIEDKFTSLDTNGPINLESLLANTNSLSESGSLITDALRTKLASLLMTDKEAIDPEKPIHTYGVDSLVAVEIRNWFKKAVAADIAIFHILGQSSLSGIGLMAASKSSLVPGSLKTESIAL